VRSDEELLERASRGDAEAFEALYRRHRDWVYRLARRFTRNEPDALDVLQETFAYLLCKLPGLHLTATMTSFLHPVVRHLSLNLRRKRAPSLADEELLDVVPAPPEAQTSRAELASALGSLPADQREVVLLRFVDDLSLEEMAEMLKTPLNTVKSRLYRALESLREDPRTRDYFLG